MVDEKPFDTITPISFKEEFDEIYEGIKSIGCNFRYMYKMATEAHLVECLSARPLGLHFSGHGCQNVLESYRGNSLAYNQNKNRGSSFLLFEQKNGASQNMYEDTLLKLIDFQKEKSNLKFVVVASCHSYSWGMIFAKSGVEHVICID